MYFPYLVTRSPPRILILGPRLPRLHGLNFSDRLGSQPRPRVIIIITRTHESMPSCVTCPGRRAHVSQTMRVTTRGLFNRGGQRGRATRGGRVWGKFEKKKINRKHNTKRPRARAIARFVFRKPKQRCCGTTPNVWRVYLFFNTKIIIRLTTLLL